MIVFSLLIPVLLLALAELRGTPRRKRTRNDAPSSSHLVSAVGGRCCWRWRRLLLGPFSVTLLNDIGIVALVALGLVLLTGVGGATSFGQAAFVGIAAYATAWLTTHAGLFALARPGVRARAHRPGRALAIGTLTLAPGRALPAAQHHRLGAVDRFLFGNVDALGRYTGICEHPADLRSAAVSLAEPRSDLLPDLGCVVGRWPACSAEPAAVRARAARSAACAAAQVMLASVGVDAFRVRLIAVRASPRCSPACRAGSMRT